MNNNFSDEYYNIENEKDDEENIVQPSKKADSFSINAELDDKESIADAHPYTEKEENVAVNVEGGP
jgi:hypothetical protein